MNISTQGLNLIKKYEGFSAQAYRCPAGILTIGYGSTTDVHSSMIITEGEAAERLREDVEDAVRLVNKHITRPLSQNQFDSLVSLSFNIGGGNFRKSTLLKYINTGKFLEASEQFLRWDKVKGKTVPGLVKRRAEEKAIFEKN